MTIIELCDRWGKLPSEVLAEPAEVLQLVALYDLGRPEVTADAAGS